MFGIGIIKGLGVTLRHFIQTYVDDIRWLGKRYYNDEAFEVRNVLCQDSRIEFEVGSGKKKIHFIKMRFRGDGSSDAITEKVQVITDLTENGIASCLVTGRIR